jgi:nitrite reductase (NADH) large subunit
VNYDRIMLSPVLAGEKTFEEIVINALAWYAEQRHQLIAGARSPIDRAAKT